MSSTSLSPEAHDVLCNAWIEGNTIKLPPDQLERSIYEEVNEVILRLGGKWKGGRIMGHVFAFYDPAPLLAGIQSSGLMPPKNPTAFFPTPAAIVADMIRAAELGYLPDSPRILEPSAGTGGIADALRAGYPHATIDVCEVLDLNRFVLEGKGHVIVADDFLTWQPGAIYDAIVMNPPFSVAGDSTAWATHLLHAWSLLKDGGSIVCITPASIQFRADATHRAISDLVGQHGGIEAIPAGAFKESGTNVATCMVWARKEAQDWRDKPYEGWPNRHQWILFLYIDNTRESSADQWNTLIDRKANNADVLAFLSGIVKEARKAGDWIAWDTHQQAFALARFAELTEQESLPVLAITPKQIEMFV